MAMRAILGADVAAVVPHGMDVVGAGLDVVVHSGRAGDVQARRVRRLGREHGTGEGLAAEALDPFEAARPRSPRTRRRRGHDQPEAASSALAIVPGVSTWGKTSGSPPSAG